MSRVAQTLGLGLALACAFALGPVVHAAQDPAEGAPAPSLFSKQPRRAQPRSAVPEEILSLLPWKGIYAAGSGADAPSWRVVVTIEGDLRAGSNPRPGSSPISLLDRKRAKLDAGALAEIFKLADKAWREKTPKKPAAAAAPVGDYSEILIIADGQDVFLLDPKTAVALPVAAELVKRLKLEGAK